MDGRIVQSAPQQMSVETIGNLPWNSGQGPMILKFVRLMNLVMKPGKALPIVCLLLDSRTWLRSYFSTTQTQHLPTCQRTQSMYGSGSTLLTFQTMTLLLLQ